MRRIAVVVVLSLAGCATEPVYACMNSSSPSFRDALQNADSVFVARLERAEFKRQHLGPDAVMSIAEGDLKILQNLYGDPTAFRKLSYQTDRCNGVKLVVGRTYLIATHGTGNMIEVGGLETSILDIEGFYDERDKKRSLRSFPILPVIRTIYRVESLPEDFPPASMMIVPVPPPPPPKH